MKKGMIQVTTGRERFVHWGLALSCLLLIFTGMAMMFHSLNVFGALFGGMYNLKVVHNYTGIVFGVFLLLAICTWWSEAGTFAPGDGEWMKVLGGYIGHVEKVPEVGKYNPGQKIFFLVVALFGLGMVASGFIMWFSQDFSVALVRLMFVVHAMGFAVIFAFFFVHLYLATIGVPGSAPAMFTGWVSRGWLKTSHPRWLHEMEKQGTLIVSGEKKST
ncbi:MAG: formate dehydrogenase subunit gamma [Desulfobulbaceae bacterium A2]|nr:MAG: formate dehydrogenase subunit gamma [Desulfobulbaceae bacterium A2]